MTLSQLQLSALVDGLYDVANNPHVGFKTAPAPPLPPVLLPHSLHCLQTAIAANLSSWEQKLAQVEAFALSLSLRYLNAPHRVWQRLISAAELTEIVTSSSCKYTTHSPRPQRHPAPLLYPSPCQPFSTRRAQFASLVVPHAWRSRIKCRLLPTSPSSCLAAHLLHFSLWSLWQHVNCLIDQFNLTLIQTLDAPERQDEYLSFCSRSRNDFQRSQLAFCVSIYANCVDGGGRGHVAYNASVCVCVH